MIVSFYRRQLVLLIFRQIKQGVCNFKVVELI
jgi:hypothetical protein